MAAAKQFLTEPKHLMWKLAHEKYDDILIQKANKKTKQSSIKELIELDKWQHLEQSYTGKTSNMVKSYTISLDAISQDDKDTYSEGSTEDFANMNNCSSCRTPEVVSDNSDCEILTPHEDNMDNTVAAAPDQSGSDTATDAFKLNNVATEDSDNDALQTADENCNKIPADGVLKAITTYEPDVAHVPNVDKTPESTSEASVDEGPKVMEVDPKLPAGWSRIVRQRKRGATSGQYDVYIIGPDNFRMRSRPEVAMYIKAHGLDIDPKDIDFTAFGQHVQAPSRGRRNKSNGELQDKVKTVRSRRPPKEKKQEKPLLIVKLNFNKGRKRKNMESCDTEKSSPARKRSKVAIKDSDDKEIPLTASEGEDEAAERRRVYSEIEKEAKLIATLTKKKLEEEEELEKEIGYTKDSPKYDCDPAADARTFSACSGLLN